MAPADLKSALKEILGAAPANIYASRIREDYFKKYPRLFGLHNAFFRIRHLKEIYGIDARKDLLQIADRRELQDLYDALTADEQAIRILSRFAVDYIYLYEILYDINPRFDTASILELKNGYDLNDTIQFHLLIYLYTHAIIADSNFYTRQVPENRLTVYRQMLKEVEKMIAGCKDIKLDNKFEYLVAARICRQPAPSAAGIYQEASSSLSSEGIFIVDKLNRARQNTLSGSEHRNVLFIMSSTAFNPHKTLIGYD